MAGINVTIANTTGSATHQGEVPHDVPSERLIKALIGVLGMPYLGQDGRPISYRLYHNGRQIEARQNLSDAGVREHDTITLSQEAVAG
jgi:hypothetical protein